MKPLVLLGALLLFGSSAGRAAERVRRDARGATVKTASSVTRVEIWSDRIVRVIHSPVDAPPPRASLSVIAKPVQCRWKFIDGPGALNFVTHALTVRLDKASGAIRIADGAGRVLLAEAPNGRSIAPTVVGGFSTWRLRQSFALAPDESIYGLGQHPDGRLDHRGSMVHLQQKNRIVALPVLVSSRGYGVLWDNPAVTDVDIGKTDPALLSWTSEAGDAIDYYVILGPSLDAVVGGYRHLTGAAPLFPRWAWGFWQCREHYRTQAELLGVLANYRRLGIPLDGIIQDWQYWPAGRWGSHDFDPARYPDPTGMVQAVHAAHAHIIVSVWPRFDLGLRHTAALERARALFPPVYPNVYPKGHGRWYDPYGEAGRRLYWQFLREKLFVRGFDGWWMDASEPELGGHWGELRDVNTGAGPGPLVFNAYPLMHSTGVYDGQRATTSAKRVFILTRSAYPGQQRNGAVTWSGDTTGNWDVFRKQIPAGLDFTITGIPYWNTDIGGFFGGDPRDPKYAELFTRWFQFGAFCPMFRVHGTGKSKAIWEFDPATQQILVEYDRLRHHLLPYIYSVSWMVTHDGYTMLRPLVMDFRTDVRAREITDQFLFGPALMANPVTQPLAVNRKVYLPAGTRWTDFWTGESKSGGQTVLADAPIERIPLYVRAGSIVPYGPDVQYANQDPAGPMELRIYPGADGDFTLYEDEGDNYDYEHGAFATTRLHWDDRDQVLAIGTRRGSFTGMMKTRTLRVVVIAPGRGSGIALCATPNAEISYSGAAVMVPLRTGPRVGIAK